MCAQGIAQIEGNVLVYVSMARLIFSHTQETSPVETLRYLFNAPFCPSTRDVTLLLKC